MSVVSRRVKSQQEQKLGKRRHRRNHCNLQLYRWKFIFDGKCDNAGPFIFTTLRFRLGTAGNHLWPAYPGTVLEFTAPECCMQLSAFWHRDIGDIAGGLASKSPQFKSLKFTDAVGQGHRHGHEHAGLGQPGSWAGWTWMVDSSLKPPAQHPALVPAPCSVYALSMCLGLINYKSAAQQQHATRAETATSAQARPTIVDTRSEGRL